MIHQIKNIKEAVKRYLTENPKLRDSDDMLIATFWWNQIDTFERKAKTAFDFLHELSHGEYASSESIRRCRQKIQEQQPELRGKSYKKRKLESEIIKQQIHSI